MVSLNRETRYYLSTERRYMQFRDKLFQLKKSGMTQSEMAETLKYAIIVIVIRDIAGNRKLFFYKKPVFMQYLN